MTMMTVLLTAWTALVALFFTLMVYRSRLIRYEDDKLFLDGHDAYGEKVQFDIVRKVNRMQPVISSIGMATGIMSLSIVGVCLYRAIVVLRS